MKPTHGLFARIIVVLALAVGLAACSAVKLGYNTLPNLAYWWLDGYVDFSDEQTPQVRQELTRLHTWHRTQELPRLAELLGRLEQLAPGPVSAQQACSFVGELQARMNIVADQAEPAVVAMALELTPQQLQHLDRKYRNNNEKYRKEWIEVAAAEQKEKRFEQMLERSEMIYGKLDEPQRAVLRQGIEQSMFDSRRILGERQRRQQDLLQTLRRVQENPPSPEQARVLMRAYLDRAQRSPDASYRNWQQELLQEGCRIFAALHDSTTAAQREQAVRRLRGYQRDLRELSAQR
jgi:hypothetical protein